MKKPLPIAALLGLATLLLGSGVIPFNNPSSVKYPVRGVDVSHYQGEIDWQTLASQGIRFAGNWREAAETGMPALDR